MKTGIVCLCVLVCIGMALVAGCMSSQGNAGTPGGTSTPGTTAPTPGAGENAAVSQDQAVTLANGTYAFNASISSITSAPLSSGGHRVDIYLTVTDLNSNPIQLQSFSTLTSAEGTSFGGIGVSHDGLGMETPPIGQGTPATGRDYVTIDSDQDYQALKNGATLTVNFVTEPFGNETPVSFVASWALNPSDFT